MSLHDEIQRRKRYQYDKELEEVADDIKTERFLDKEDADAPIIVTKEQLEAKRCENNGLTADESHPHSQLEDKLILPLLGGFLLSVILAAVIGKIFTFFYALFFGFMMFAIRAYELNKMTGEWKKVSLIQRIVFLLLSLAMLALAIKLTIQWT